MAALRPGTSDGLAEVIIKTVWVFELDEFHTEEVVELKSELKHTNT